MAHSNCCGKGGCGNGSGGCEGCPSKKPGEADGAPEQKPVPAGTLPSFGKRRIDIFHDVSLAMERRVKARLDALLQDGDDPILVRINTYGGFTRVAIGIHELLVNAGPPIVTAVFGYAYSAGSIILQAGDQRLATPNSRVMIHQESSFAYGHMNTDDAEKDARERRWSEEQLEAIFANRGGQSPAVLREWFSKDKYMTATEAVQLGFADALLLPRNIKENPVSPGLLRGLTRRADRLLHGLAGLGAFAGMMESIFGQDEDDDEDDSASADRPRLHRRR